MNIRSHGERQNEERSKSMGFGTLFIGYFFLLNISYFAYTDVIAALVMTLGLYKLSTVNKSFYYASLSSALFSIFAFFELIVSAIDAFAPILWLKSATPYISAIRYIFIFITTLFIMRGISEVADEVEANALCATAKNSIFLSSIFIIAALFEMPFISDLFGAVIAYVYFAILLAVVVFIISNLMTIYKAYMQICMPEELKRAPKKSKFEFLNKFYDSIEEKSRTYAEYKLEKSKEKAKKKKGGGKSGRK